MSGRKSTMKALYVALILSASVSALVLAQSAAPMPLRGPLAVQCGATADDTRNVHSGDLRVCVTSRP